MLITSLCIYLKNINTKTKAGDRNKKLGSEKTNKLQ